MKPHEIDRAHGADRADGADRDRAGAVELSGPDGVDAGAGRLAVTDRARRALVRLCHDHGQQALLLSWPGGAATIPLEHYSPGHFDVIIGHVASCPIYVDVRQLGSTPIRSAVLDVDRSAWRRDWPLLRLKRERGGLARSNRAAPG